MNFSRISWVFSIGFIGVLLLWFACRRNFDLSEREVNFNKNLIFGLRIDVTLDPSFLFAYSGRFRCLLCGSNSCQNNNCGGRAIGTVYSEDIGALRVNRVLSGKYISVLIKGPEGYRKSIKVPIIDSSRSKLLLRSKLIAFSPDQKGNEYTIEKALVLNDQDSVIMASPLRTQNNCLNFDKCRYRDSLVDSLYRLPVKFKIPKIDNDGIVVVNLRMCFAGKDLWSKLPPDSLGYISEDFKTSTLTDPKYPNCNGNCP